MKKALITGVNGFVGRYLARELASDGYDVWGTSRSGQPSDYREWKVLQLDLLHEEQIMNVINELMPDEIYHLAGQSSVRDSWLDKAGVLDANVLATTRLLEAVRKSAPANKIKVLTVGSSEEYGKVADNQLPIEEGTKLRPISPYGISKAAVSLLAQHYYDVYGMKIIHARPFNHIGPGQSLGFVTSDFAKQISDIEKGLISPALYVGNLEAKRDFTDVRDIVRAYRLLLKDGESGNVYNICSGSPVSIQAILDYYLRVSSCKDIHVIPDENKMRPSDIPLYYGDSGRIVEATQWGRTINLEQSLTDILNYWRAFP